jgi:hypothetical protein
MRSRAGVVIAFPNDRLGTTGANELDRGQQRGRRRSLNDRRAIVAWTAGRGRQEALLGDTVDSFHPHPALIPTGGGVPKSRVPG